METREIKVKVCATIVTVTVQAPEITSVSFVEKLLLKNLLALRCHPDDQAELQPYLDLLPHVVEE